MTKLKPCPFCGGKRISTAHNVGGPLRWAWCKDCDAEGPLADSEQAAIERWNTRADKAEVKS